MKMVTWAIDQELKEVFSVPPVDSAQDMREYLKFLKIWVLK